MRQVVVILGVSIRPEDARWLDFGLNRPRRSLGTSQVVVSEMTKLSPIEPVTLPQEKPAKTLPALAA